MKGNLVIISNIVFEPYLKKYLDKTVFRKVSSIPVNEIGANDEIVREAEAVVICLNFDVLFPDIQSEEKKDGSFYKKAIECSVCFSKAIYRQVRGVTKERIIWFGFEDYYLHGDAVYGTLLPFHGLIDTINQMIEKMLVDDVFIDMKRLIARVGTADAYNTRGKYRWCAPYSEKFIEQFAKEIKKQHRILNGESRKCIVLDCDCVLWGGILSEEGMEGIRLGESGLGLEYHEFQQFLSDLYYHGVILAVCSKNDEKDVLEVFRKHGGMVLREEQIACFAVNWGNKAKNLETISETLNIGLESMVFVDDSPLEVEAMKAAFPEVISILYNRNTIFDELAEFNLERNARVQQVGLRTQVYQTNSLRREIDKKCANREELFNALNIQINIHQMTKDECARVSELTQRTNKCTNGRRYTIVELKEKETVHLYSVSMTDKFSDFGIVGAMEIEGDRMRLFSLSCRALGYGIEEQMYRFIKARYQINIIEFENTTKNSDFFNSLSAHFPNVEYCPICL